MRAVTVPLSVLALALGVLPCMARQGDGPRDLALSRPYTVSPAPSYAHCTDPGDATQLTDGRYVEGYFWTQQGTVGWTGGQMVSINIDLGRVEPIGGLSFDTAAGVAGVHWPASILVFVSDDGHVWHQLGDLVAMQKPGFLPDYGTYAARKLTASGLKAHGRYVQLAVMPEGSYVFCDEVEVLEGPAADLSAPLPGQTVEGDVAAVLKKVAFNNLLKVQYRRDLAAAQADLATLDLSVVQRLGLDKRFADLTRRVEDAPLISPEGFHAVLPMTPLEADIFAFQAEVWRAERKPQLRVWKCHRWDLLAPSDEPGPNPAAPRVYLRMMDGEVRSDVVNLTSAAPEVMRLRLRIEGLPGGVNPGYITVRQVLDVGTRYFQAVAAALPVADRVKGDWILTVPSGMTSQAWLEFSPRALAPGRYEGKLVLQAETEGGRGAGPTFEVPVGLYVSHIRFPKETSLLLGGWSYTDGQGARGVTPQNREALIRYLRDHDVNAPWASGAAMPEGTFDAGDNLTAPPNTSRFDEWVGKWRGSRMYMVYLAAGDSFAGARMGTQSFDRRVGAWAHFWARHLRDLGLKPSQLGLLVSDEPHDAAGYAINADWSQALHAAEPEIKTFVDPIPQQPGGMDAMVKAVSILCPQRPMWLTMDWWRTYCEHQANYGKTLWFYSCSGPTRSFDPYSYYLLQEWQAFEAGATGSCFWSFSDTGGASTWNDYVTAGAGPYCPMYLDNTSVTSAKWMEAIREGVEDYEYLKMLSDWMHQHQAEASDRPAYAERVLKKAVAEVLATQDPSNFRWDRPTDRSAADHARYDVLDALERLY